ncbi:uncharacterized protein LOC126377246 isoform X2 [Pectinophora gossypiella]|nr:uncharacterized protein LOC126377246 isoform X2 [Pectinophora gossypiella]XP_049880925.1 uncharacterized protein LOC126377246 isoform X2 [Pectinophora gossypiella]
MGVTSLFLLVVVVTCFLSEQVTAVMDENTCTQQITKSIADLNEDVKNNKRNTYRKHCEEVRKLVDECIREHSNLAPMKLEYESNCLGAEVQKWLKSSGSMVQGNLVTGILTILTIMVRL